MNFNFIFSISSPETGPITSAADIWAYGIVIWEMISLSVPHVEHLDESELLDESATESMLDQSVAESKLDVSNVDMNESGAFLNEIMPRATNTCGEQFSRIASELLLRAHLNPET